MSLDVILKDWKIELHSGIPVYKQIINRFTAAIAAGTLKCGDRLPTIRELNELLGVNPNTVAKAYRELTLKGFIDGQRGSGSYVKAVVPVAPLPEQQKNAKLGELYQRLLAEAHGHGLREEEIIAYIQERKIT
ncbi:MAG TPA: GntR family transcriptional regulator [Verrucomicrobiae bacterium]